MESMGLWMLITLGLLLIATGLPAWSVLLGVSVAFALGGVITGAVASSWLSAMPNRVLGLLENDLLQALPLYVFMGALLNRLPLARTLFRAGRAALHHTSAGAPLAGLTLGVLLAPMNGSVGASVATLSRIVQPQLDAGGMAPPNSAALVCVASTLGVVIPPSLVLILLGDAMMRAHTEAVNLTRDAVRIINTQDVFVGALAPAAILLVLCFAITWLNNRHRPSDSNVAPIPTRTEWITAAATAVFIVALLASVTLGYLYAVEAAAAGGVALFLFGVSTRTLTRTVLGEVLRDTMAITGAIFALLVAATVFTLIVRAYGTDRWMASVLNALGGGAYGVLILVLAVLAVCALVLDAFEMIFVVIPIVMPPLLTRVHDATWVAVLALLILQASFLAPPFGYAVLVVRNRMKRPLPMKKLSVALLPYLFAQLCVLALVLVFPSLVWQRNPTELTSTGAGESDEKGSQMIERQLQQQETEQRGESEEVK